MLLIPMAFIGTPIFAAEPSVNVITLTTTRPYEGLIVTDETHSKPPLHMHIATIDLTNPHLHVATPRPPKPDDPTGTWQVKLQTVRTTAENEGLAVAVNGDFFMYRTSVTVLGRKYPYFPGNWASVCGLAMTDGQCWSQRPSAVSLMVDDAGKISIGPLVGVPKQARQVVSSINPLVIHGRNVGPFDVPAPHTAVGIDKEGKSMALLVVDGRRPDFSVGLTLNELADKMIQLGCQEAMNLDGGGSSTLVLRDPPTGQWIVLNRPSDGHDLPIDLSLERPVANVLGVRIDGIGPATSPADAPANPIVSRPTQ